ncbi:MAG: protoporphyrinogen/coproporphyrinogen oxidase [Actinomycetota bacterium]
MPQVRTHPRMNRREHRFVILGAGLTGLSAAARLDELGERDYLLVEREDRPGGWAKTDFTGAYGADRAGHVLYFRDGDTRRRVERLLDGRWIRHAKNCVVDSMGVRTPFPFHANLHGRPHDLVAECLRGLLDASADHAMSPSPATFLEWILHSYGPGIARHFMVPYNTKMWTVPPELMTADWMGGFVPPIDIRRALEGARLRVDSRVGLNAEFFYPEKGISALADALSSELQGEVRYNTTATKIAPGEKLVYLDDGSAHSFESVISTIPLTRLAGITDGLPPLVTEVAASLTAVDLVLVDIGVRCPKDEGVHWAYLPDADVLGFRLSAVHNLTDRLMPTGHGLYTVEIAHSTNRPLRGSSLQRRVVADLVRLGWLRSESDITFLQERRFECAYALPLLGSAQAAAASRRHLEAIDIHPVGRFAEWKYSNMEDALLDGRAAVDRLVLGSTPIVPR